ncbi:MAG: hypothetical protein ACJAV3_000474 [Alcanivorax sp.]|jgi:hypothetical protein
MAMDGTAFAREIDALFAREGLLRGSVGIVGRLWSAML